MNTDNYILESVYNTDMTTTNNCEHEIETEMIDTENEVTFCVRCNMTLGHRRFVSDEEIAIPGEI